LQFINAYLGGTLYQDLPAQLGQEIAHSQAPPHDRPTHRVTVREDSPLFPQKEILVNSFHHQGVKTLSPKLTMLASADDGLVETAYMPDRRFVLAVQWHPEFMPDDAVSKRLFRAFVNGNARL
jgi:putative glutamine amidotransferase